MNPSETGTTGAGGYVPPPAYGAATGAPNTGYPAGNPPYPEKSGPPPTGPYPAAYPTQPDGYAPGQAPYPSVPGQAPYPSAPGQAPYPGAIPNTGYGAAPGAPTTYVYVQQPVPLTNPPNDYFGYSLFVTICCCWLIGLFAIMKSMECRNATRAGNRPLAEVKSREARNLSHVALGIGILCIVVVIVVVIVRVAVLSSHYY